MLNSLRGSIFLHSPGSDTLHILLISFIIWYKCTIDRVGLITVGIFSSMTGMTAKTEGTEGTHIGIIMTAHEIFSWTRRKVEA